MQGPVLTLLLTSALYTFPIALIFIYGFYLICNIDYPEEDSEKNDRGVCPTCNNRRRSERWEQYARIGEVLMTPKVESIAKSYNTFGLISFFRICQVRPYFIHED